MQTLMIWRYGVLLVIVLQRPLSSVSDVTNIQVKDNAVAVKGQQVVLVCSISNFDGQVYVHRADTNATYTSTRLTYCTWSSCQLPILSRYKFASNTSNIIITIQTLNRSEDEAYWTCIESSNRQQLFLTVYTVPEAVTLTASPTKDIDLSVESVSFTCATTNCVSPAPNFTWYISVNGGEIRYNATSTRGNLSLTCSDREQRYTSTFTLQQYSKSSDNQDKEVHFQCGIESFPGMASPLNSSWSGSVRYAVQVKSVYLTFGGSTSNNTDTITVGSGVRTTLKCTPGTSRPAAMVVWYIGNEEKQNSSVIYEFNLGFKYEDNDQQIYCKAVNIPGAEVWSTKPKLYVQVEVSNISIQDNNKDLNDGATVNVTNGTSKTLTCVPSLCRPAATVTWYIGGVQMTSSNTSYNFTFIPTDDDHNKHMYCTASNLQTTVTSKLAVLYVRVSPRVLAMDKYRFKSFLGATFNDSIPVYCQPQDMIIINIQRTDNRNSRLNVTAVPSIVTASRHGYIVMLHIDSVTGNDFGNYSLNISNSVGSLEWNFVLEEQSKPSLVTHFKYIGIINGDPTFYMEVGYNGGYQQDFSIETAIDDTWTQRLWFNESDSRYLQPNGTFIFSIPELGPGSYKVRVIPSNVNGKADQWQKSLTVTFIIGHKQGQDSMCLYTQTKCTQTSAIIGGVVSSIVVCVLTAIITALIARHYLKPTKDESHTYEGVKPEGNVINLYDSLEQETKGRHDEYANTELTNSWKNI